MRAWAPPSLPAGLPACRLGPESCVLVLWCRLGLPSPACPVPALPSLTPPLGAPCPPEPLSPSPSVLCEAALCWDGPAGLSLPGPQGLTAGRFRRRSHGEAPVAWVPWWPPQSPSGHAPAFPLVICPTCSSPAGPSSYKVGTMAEKFDCHYCRDNLQGKKYTCRRTATTAASSASTSSAPTRAWSAASPSAPTPR